MDYLIGIIVVVFVMALAWSGRGRNVGETPFFTEVLTGIAYFIAFSVGSVIAAVLVKALLVLYECGSAWALAMLADGTLVSANVAARLEYDRMAGVNLSFGVGANILWGWVLCFLAFGFRVFSGRWPHQRAKSQG